MRIAAITGSRADYPAIMPVAEALHGAHEVHVISLWKYLDISDDRGSQAQQAGYLIHHVNGMLSATKADVALLNGDRWEVLAAAVACYIMAIPIIHLSGGDQTPGSADDQMRDAISMLASLHFPTHFDAAERLRAMGVRGEAYSFGAPATDRIINRKDVSREAAFEPTGLEPNHVNVIIAVHPETSANAPDTCGEILAACSKLEHDVSEMVSFYVTSPNGDYGKSVVAAKLKTFAARPTATMLPNLTPEQFTALLDHCDLMVGNSSAGIYEAPVMGLPSIIVGPRQVGRQKVAFGYCGASRDQIFVQMTMALTMGRIKPVTIFGNGDVAKKIATVIDRYNFGV